jgi:Flp pilus assembly protein TadG
MNLPRRLDRRARRGESGVAALEFALVLPILMLLILGVVSIGHGLVVRYVLSSASYDAARTCTMARTATATCARAIIQSRINGAGGAAWCTSIDVQVTDAPEPDYPAVNAVTVDANCNYRGIIATGYLQSQGLAIFDIHARAVMPY